MIGEPFSNMDEVKDEIASWGISCKGCGAQFMPTNGEQFCDGC